MGDITVQVCDVKCDYECVGIDLFVVWNLKMYVVSNIAFYFV